MTGRLCYTAPYCLPFTTACILCAKQFEAPHFCPSLFFLNYRVCPYVFPRWTGRATAAWSRNCPPFVKTRRTMKSSTPCHGHLAHLCGSRGGLAHPCAHPSCPQGPFVPPLITAAQPRFRYLWSASAVPLQSSAPGVRTSHTYSFIFISFVGMPSKRTSL